MAKRNMNFSQKVAVATPPLVVLENGRVEIAVERIVPNPEQPRKVFDAVELGNLAQSIRENGVILPIAVEASANGMYILHDGERRLRAAKLCEFTRSGMGCRLRRECRGG